MGIFKKYFGGEPKPGKPIPVSDDTFADDVLNSEIPVAVDFWSPTCAPCQVMGGLLDEIGPEYLDRVKIVKVRVDHNPGISGQYGIRSIPTLILFHKGKEIHRQVGLIPLNPMRQLFDKLAAMK